MTQLHADNSHMIDSLENDFIIATHNNDMK